jgi:hypothetical protein
MHHRPAAAVVKLKGVVFESKEKITLKTAPVGVIFLEA